VLACRAFAYLMEALPSSAASIVNYQAIPLLCAKLLAIEYIDVAEQALQV
jgi:E3 ubiquitin-protein ligase TRIP12